MTEKDSQRKKVDTEELRDALAYITLDRAVASHYLGRFCAFAARYYRGEAWSGTRRTGEEVVDGVVLIFGTGAEEIKIGLEPERTRVLFSRTESHFESDGNLVVPPTNLLDEEHLVLATSKGAVIRIGIKIETTQDGVSLRSQTASIESLPQSASSGGKIN